MIDITKLEEGLENLTGFDYEKAITNFSKKHREESFGVPQLNSNI